MNDNPNVIALHRVSTDAQDVARQRADTERGKVKFGMTVARILELVGVSGTATLEDNQVQQVLKDLERPEIDGIFVSALDRLFRPGKRFGQFAILDRFVDQRKQIWSMREGMIDPATDEGYDKCILAGGRAGAEWRELIRRNRDGRLEHLKEGELDHGTPPDGYTYIPKWKPNGKHFEINPQRAEIIRQIFELRRIRTKTYRIAKILNDQGILSARGGRWSRNVVLQILRNAAYKGQHRRFGIIVPCPVIIDPDLWEEVQRITAQNRSSDIGRPSLKPFLVRGMLWCARCGRRCIMFQNSTSVQYRCGNFTAKPPYTRHCDAPGINQVVMDNAFWALIWEHLRDREFLIGCAREHYREMERPMEIGSIEREIARLRQRIARTQAMVQDGLMEHAQGRCEIREMKTQIERLNADLRAAGKIASLPTRAAAEAAINEMFVDPEVQEPTTFEGRRHILEGLIDLRGTYDAGNLVIEGQIPMGDPNESIEGKGKKKCNSRICAASNSFAPIPFILKRKIA